MAKKIKAKADKPQNLDAALQYYQSGDFLEAENRCRKILEKNPKQSDAWYLLGMIMRKCGQNKTAINYISRAIHLNPEMPSYYYDIGLSFWFGGNTDEAIRNYSKAVELKPDYAEAHFQRGFILQQQNRLEEAMKSFERVIMFQPDNAEAHNNKGLVYLRQGDIEVAITSFKRALTLEPDYAEAYNNLGLALAEKELFDEAIDNYRKALIIKPDFVDVLNNLGIAYTDNNLLDEAIENYRKALILKPYCAEAYINLGNAFKDKGRMNDSIENYERALALHPENAQTLFILGMAYLLAKDFERGWQEYEWRLKAIKMIPLKKTKWDGSSLDGKIILVYSEQGYGDILQFVRYLSGLYEDYRAKKVLFFPRKGLEHLLRGSDLRAEILDADTSVETLEYDTNIHLLSLPGIFKTDLDNIPFKQKRYLKANDEKVLEYKNKYFNNAKFKVGIFWHGSPLFMHTRKKAIPLSCFYPLCRLPDVTLYSLQKGDGIEQMDNLPEDIEVINLGETFNDFSDTASAIENLDLVITIDTAIAHLSGALGKKTWILLPSYAEWRWHLDMDYSPWYEDVRLFRHKEPGKKDWEEMMKRVKEEVKVEVKRQVKEKEKIKEKNRLRLRLRLR